MGPEFLLLCCKPKQVKLILNFMRNHYNYLFITLQKAKLLRKMKPVHTINCALLIKKKAICFIACSNSSNYRYNPVWGCKRKLVDDLKNIFSKYFQRENFKGKSKKFCSDLKWKRQWILWYLFWIWFAM
jgi:hypothetical protein